MDYKQNFSVKAVLRTDKKRVDGTCSINYQVIIDSQTTKLSSKESPIKPSDWVKKTGHVKGSVSSQVNSNIDNDIARIKKYLNKQRAMDNYLSIDMVKAFWSMKDSDDFYEYFDAFCKDKFKEIAVGTQNHYVLLRKRLKEFKPNIRLSQIDLSFVKGFDNFLRRKLETGDSGVWSRHKNLKVVLSNAYKQGRIRKNPYDDFKLEQKEPTEMVYLTPIEIRLIEKKRFSNFPRGKGLVLTRDIFLFSCYTGLRFSDVLALKKEHIINDEVISLRQQKTSNFVQVPLIPKAKAILLTYKTYEGQTIFPKRTNATANRDLKQIATSCGIKKLVKFHLSRHTFASILANEGINLIQIMKLLGHKNIKTTQIYVNSNIDDLKKSMTKVPIFN